MKHERQRPQFKAGWSINLVIKTGLAPKKWKKDKGNKQIFTFERLEPGNFLCFCINGLSRYLLIYYRPTLRKL